MKNNDLRKERFYELVDSGTSIDLARHLAGFKTGEFKRLRRADSDLDLLVREKAKKRRQDMYARQSVYHNLIPRDAEGKETHEQ